MKLVKQKLKQNLSITSREPFRKFFNRAYDNSSIFLSSRYLVPTSIELGPVFFNESIKLSSILADPYSPGLTARIPNFPNE